MAHACGLIHFAGAKQEKAMRVRPPIWAGPDWFCVDRKEIVWHHFDKYMHSAISINSFHGLPSADPVWGKRAADCSQLFRKTGISINTRCANRALSIWGFQMKSINKRKKTPIR